MKNYNFTLVLDSGIEINDATENMLFEAGCDDALLLRRNGIIYLDFDREGATLSEAVRSAIKQVECDSTTVQVKRVEPSDLVTSAEIARRLNRSRQSVQQLISGSRGNGTFPVPLAGVTTKTMIWSWVHVCKWLLDNSKITDASVYDDAVAMKQINDILEARSTVPFS
ncbi:MAG: hypothetical protein JJU41_07160 [Bacteroidetes bacterium]|nr:hypothetical protein [Bacteroidota bacterium]MCH8524844.1 hypothetical protein [Balneolales bacterium]